jgi:prepilin-type N-terminal cleavage/methylation domain-containing protein
MRAKQRQHADPEHAHSERGFSLVEILMALVVITIGIMGVAQMFPSASRGQVRDKMLQGATYLAQEQLETLSNLTWSDPSLTAGRHPAAGVTACGTNNAWNRYWKVTAMAAPLDNLKLITVIVQWSAVGRADSVMDSTYVRR